MSKNFHRIFSFLRLISSISRNSENMWILHKFLISWISGFWLGFGQQRKKWWATRGNFLWFNDVLWPFSSSSELAKDQSTFLPKIWQNADAKSPKNPQSDLLPKVRYSIQKWVAVKKYLDCKTCYGSRIRYMSLEIFYTYHVKKYKNQARIPFTDVSIPHLIIR